MSPEEIRDVVMRRLLENGEFPAMAETVMRVNSITASEGSSASELASAILADYTLTVKILRLVNSALFAQPTEVTTISRAIVVLGWKTIRSLVLTLKLFDSLPRSANAQHARVCMASCFLSGMVARHLGATLPGTDEEEAFICALFHCFGHILVTFYAPEREAAIRAAVQDDPKRENAIVRRVLGTSYRELGQALARELNFPGLVLDSMNPAPRPQVPKRPNKAEMIVGLAAVSSAVSRVLMDGNDLAKARVSELFKQFEEAYGVPRLDVEALIEASIDQFESQATLMQLPVGAKSTSARVLDNFHGRRTEAVAVVADVGSVAIIEPRALAEESDRIFAQGIQDASACLDAKGSVADVLLVVLETMFRGLAYAGGSRALFLMKEPTRAGLEFRSGIGRGLDGARTWLRLPLDATAGALRVALDHKKDLHLESLGASVAERALPLVLRKLVQDDGFVIVLPIVVSDRPIGLFFLDGKGDQKIAEPQLRSLSALRDRVVEAIVRSARQAA